MLIRSFGGAAARLVFAALAIFAFSAAAEAQYITFVASNGNDANPCTAVTAPCKTLQRAVNVTTASGGVVKVLTPLISSVFINKNITISGDGAPIVGQITIAGGVVVTLRGLALNGVAGFVNGIRIDSAAAVHIEDCTVERYTGDGIKLLATSATQLYISDTVSRDNGGAGLLVDDVNAQVTVEDSRFERNSFYGLYLKAAGANIIRSVASGSRTVTFGTGDGIHIVGGYVSITDTTATGNAESGFLFSGGASATLDSSVARANFTGLVLAGTATSVTITNCVIFGNPNAAISRGSATLFYTRQNNIVGGNNFTTATPVTPF